MYVIRPRFESARQKYECLRLGVGVVKIRNQDVAEKPRHDEDHLDRQLRQSDEGIEKRLKSVRKIHETILEGIDAAQENILRVLQGRVTHIKACCRDCPLNKPSGDT